MKVDHEKLCEGLRALQEAIERCEVVLLELKKDNVDPGLTEILFEVGRDAVDAGAHALNHLIRESGVDADLDHVLEEGEDTHPNVIAFRKCLAGARRLDAEAEARTRSRQSMPQLTTV